MRSFDAAIVGGGIVGAACAASLSKAGLSVAVIEATGIASGATAAGMGHIVVMDDSEAQFALTRYSQQLWNEIAGELPEQAEFDNCGTIWIAADDEEMGEVRRKHEYYSNRAIRSEVLDEKALRLAEPNLRHELAGGLRVAGDSVVYQLGAASFLIQKARHDGAHVIVGKKVIEISDNGVTLADGVFIAAGAVINAAGTAAATLSPDLKIVNRKGHLVITERYPNFARHQLVELGYLKSAHSSTVDSVAFNVQPRKTGQVILGSSRQFGALDSEVDREILGRMTLRAFEYMPALKRLSAIRVWTGFRPATPDNLPYIGKLRGHRNVYAAVGHEGLGITTSLGTGALIADMILNRRSAIPVGPYSPERIIKEH
jgi:D-hydroxyproline dehydrogenase subunit beta